ncbi:MAG TPA: cyclic dehypoxanthinyl futalosine synthase [Candidatus Udaeobacter sp.]|jgi:dehypoxanthine futalosine cyclase|nr:cyclic dehypoxanthinyl futalosine synthase [Candidatus Udaeobacter sp.]
MWSTIQRKAGNRERLTPEEGVHLLTTAPLLELGALAQEVRDRRTNPRVVTYVVDTNPNYTNICTVDCHFCAFYRKPGANAPDAYTYDLEGVMKMMADADALGATTVLLQGGLNPSIPWEFYPSIVREARRRFPHITPHFFSAPEIHQMVEVSGLTIRGVLEALYEAGQRTLPGGGAEILATRVRRRISVKKGGPEAWLDVHREAHRVGMRSTATMMFGHVETDAEVIEHLTSVRALQDETGGFTAFVPWSYKRGNTPMESKVKHVAGASRYLRILASARLYLDNFDHIQATWFSEGKKTGQISLHFGADDFGGTLFEENVHLATGHLNKTTIAEIETLIRESGFTPAQRTTLYEIVRTAPGPEALGTLSADVPLFVEGLSERPAEYPEVLEGEELPVSSTVRPPG